VALALLAGCADRPAAQPRTEPQQTAAPTAARFTTFELRRTGGIAGLSDRIAVTPEGAWTATAKNGAQRTGQLSADQLSRLLAYTSDQRLSGEALRTQAPTSCRDAFSYVVTVDAVSVAYVDCPADGEPPQVAGGIVRLLHQVGVI
jgi:hypothetical protein